MFFPTGHYNVLLDDIPNVLHAKRTIKIVFDSMFRSPYDLAYVMSCGCTPCPLVWLNEYIFFLLFSTHVRRAGIS